MDKLEFNSRTVKISVDYAKCATCKTKNCIEACKKFGTTLFKLEGENPVLVYSEEETQRRCIEDLACEIYCQSQGKKGLVIHLEMFGLNSYRKKVGLS